MRVPCGFKADLIVEDAVIVEVKSIERLAPIHQATMITCLRLADCPLGLILNFNSTVMKDGVKRVVNNFPAARGGQKAENPTIDSPRSLRALRLIVSAPSATSANSMTVVAPERETGSILAVRPREVVGRSPE